jgi:hypothetical protein
MIDRIIVYRIIIRRTGKYGDGEERCIIKSASPSL